MNRRKLRWLVTSVTILAGLAVLVSAESTESHALQRERSEVAALSAAQHTLAGVQSEVRGGIRANRTASSHRQALASSIGTVLDRVKTTDSTLDQADSSAWLLGANITTLDTCLDGVKSAYQEVGADDNGRAAEDIAAVSGPCTSLEGGSTEGLVYPFDFPDPDVLEVGSAFFAYATNSVAGNIQIIESSDLVHWSAVGNALPSLPKWASADGTWAPGVVVLGGKVLLYYAAEVAGVKGDLECISVASSDDPSGPFTDSSKSPLECQKSIGGSIDPFPFTTGGHTYLLWKSGGGGGKATIWSQQLDSEGTGFEPKTSPVALLGPDQAWENGLVEAPDMVAVGGHYFLFFSGGGNWDSAGYAVGAASCKGPLGPCTDTSSKPILSSGPGTAGPGGESIFMGTTGSYWIAFDAYIPGAVGYPNSRDLFIRRLDLSGLMPVVEPGG